MNIAIFLPNWIGDAVMATPALRALRNHYADSHFVGVLKPYVAGVLEGGDWFDDLLLAHDGTWRRGNLALALELRRVGIDLAILFPNSFRAALVAWLGGCRRIIGYARYGRSLLLSEALPPLRDPQGHLVPSPIIDAYNLLAKTAGCQQTSYRMELYTTVRDEQRAEEVWQRTGLRTHRRVVCLNPGAAFGAAKHWPNEYFATLARRLASEHACGILVLCGPTERELCRAIVKQAAHPAVHGLADEALSLGLTKACIRRSHLLITTDSGPRHFAAAFARPVVTLFGPTHIAWTETYTPNAIHLQKPVPCGPCQKRVCPLDHRCMKELLPDEVFASATRLLEHSFSAAS